MPIRREALLREKTALARIRVLALAEGTIDAEPLGHLVDLTFLGMAGMKDPVHPEVPDAIRRCYSAGIDVAMVLATIRGRPAQLARRQGLRFTADQVLTGEQMRQAERGRTDSTN
ncbi:hypothetical protein AU476_29945 [Cupriavidus sp. UYMSc13B]|nr:hypothetical protein AU476_29945 [Cupriavidus sp. UYMSc13B]